MTLFLKLFVDFFQALLSSSYSQTRSQLFIRITYPKTRIDMFTSPILLLAVCHSILPRTQVLFLWPTNRFVFTMCSTIWPHTHDPPDLDQKEQLEGPALRDGIGQWQMEDGERRTNSCLAQEKASVYGHIYRPIYWDSYSRGPKQEFMRNVTQKMFFLRSIPQNIKQNGYHQNWPSLKICFFTENWVIEQKIL